MTRSPGSAGAGAIVGVADAAAAAAGATLIREKCTGMLTRPRFKPHLRVATVPEEGVFVLSGAKQALLRGRLYELIVPHVDGRSPDDICDLLRPHASAAEVYFTLSQLERRGLLHDADETSSLTADEAQWWSRQDV